MDSIVKLFENPSSTPSTLTHEAAIFRTQGRLGHALKDSRSPVGGEEREECGGQEARVGPFPSEPHPPAPSACIHRLTNMVSRVRLRFEL